MSGERVTIPPAQSAAVSPSLPVEEILPALQQALTSHTAAVLVAPPGSGKTTRVPLALRDAPWLHGRKIIMLEPRRIAARLAAGYMAGLCGNRVGETVGYQVRFERRVAKDTRIEVITEGLLTRRLQHDPELADVGLVIFDEFHERSLDADLALALCIDVQDALRSDLRLLVMSATMDTGPVSKMLGNCPVIEGKGRMYPVTIRHLPPLPRFDSSRPVHLARSVVRALREIVEREQGDILVFLPGVGEIHRVAKQFGEQSSLVVRPLHGGLKVREQELALAPDPGGRQRLILATTIAETSVTIEGVSVVVDCGWKRVPRFYPDTGLTGLDTVRISRASARQRAGRAGRVGPGTCYRLWHTGVEAGLQDYDLPEIRQADLAPLMLELTSWGVQHPEQLTWLDMPGERAVTQARDLLTLLGALNHDGRITELGRSISLLPLHPRLATMVVLAGEKNRRKAMDLAALLSERDILPAATTVDMDTRLYCLRRYRRDGASAVLAMDGHVAACARVNRVSQQLARLARTWSGPVRETLSTGGLLALAYPDRIARRRFGSQTGYKVRTGGGGCLSRQDPLAASEWLVVVAQKAGGHDGRIFLAAALDWSELMDIYADSFVRHDEIGWDANKRAVTCRQCVRLGSLLVEERPLARPDQALVQQALLTGIRELGLAVLPWTPAARNLQARVCCLRQWQPEANWPDFSDAALLATLDGWLLPFLGNIKNIRGCGALSLSRLLLSRLDYQQQKSLNRDAPTHIQVPSGSRVTLQYSREQPPVLAVRLQEMFGLAKTPTICRGQVKVLLHLLSPARRTVQITQDLAGFWSSSYFAVRKEMKGRYPKHHWPTEPWEARATAGSKRAGKK